MAKYSAADVAFVLIGGYSLLAFVTEMPINTEAVLEESHTLGDSWVEQTPVDLARFDLSMNGYYDDDAGASNAAWVRISTGTPAAEVACVGLAGNTHGNAFIGFQGVYQATYERVAARGALTKANVTYRGTGQVDEGKILLVHGTVSTSSANGTALDNGASSAGGGVGYLQVSALTLGGYDDVVFKIQHSSDNSTYADLITFTAVTAAPNAQRGTSAATVNRYTRYTHAYTGAGSGQSFIAFVGFKRNA